MNRPGRKVQPQQRARSAFGPMTTPPVHIHAEYQGFEALVAVQTGAMLQDAQAYLAERRGILLEPLKEAAYFRRCFVDAGALCWPNGLELSGQWAFLN